MIIILIADFYLFERFLPNFWFSYFSFFISDSFNFIDIPDYRDKETLWNKLTYAIDNATTFEIVWENYTKPWISIRDKIIFLYLSVSVSVLVVYFFDFKNRLKIDTENGDDDDDDSDDDTDKVILIK